VDDGGQRQHGLPARQGVREQVARRVSDGDAEALRSAFNVKTVQDLGRNKYFKAAAALVALHEAGAK
jgi:hypothetical protein